MACDLCPGNGVMAYRAFNDPKLYGYWCPRPRHILSRLKAKPPKAWAEAWQAPPLNPVAAGMQVVR